MLHWAELDIFVAEDQVPARHGKACEVEEPGGQKKPGKHDPEGAIDAIEQNWPAGQVRQCEADVNPETFENVPAGQAYCVRKVVPAGQ
jgi:hypothetical protein